MSNRIYREDGDTMVVDGGYGRGYGNEGGGFGGIGAIIALVVVVAILWFLAREGRGCNDGCYNGGGGYPYPPAYPYPPVYPYGGGNCCNSPLDCKIPMAPDMSNCEIDKDLWKVDADIWKANCDVKETVKDGDQKILDKLCEQEYNAVTRENQTLRDKLLEANTDKKFEQVISYIAKTDNNNDKAIAGLYGVLKDLKCDIDCNFPKRAPVYACGTTPDVHNIDCHDYFPKRRGFNDGCGCDNDRCCG